MRVTLKSGDMLYLPSLWYAVGELLCNSKSINAQPQVSQSIAVLRAGGDLRCCKLLVRPLLIPLIESFVKGSLLTVSNRYDMEFGGFHYASNTFIRDVVLAAAAANAKNSKP